MVFEGESMTVYDSLTACFNSFLACIGLERSANPAGTPLINDHRFKELHSQGQVIETHSFSEDFWGSSTGDLDYAFCVSQRSISSLSTSNFSFQSDLVSASANAQNEFVNHGRDCWNQTRLQWIRGTKLSNEAHHAPQHAISLLGSKECFRRPIPLPEMVDFLVEVWEQEGLYD